MNALEIMASARNSGRRSINEAYGKEILSEFQIAVPKSVIVTSPEQVEAAVSGLNPPFAVKVMSENILHKSDAGGVALELGGARDVSEAITAMAALPLIMGAHVEGYLIEEMVARGMEVFVGAVRDPQFGPMLMVGLGGIFVEVLKDVSFRICPISRADGFAMLDELRGAEILGGTRGRAGVSKDAIVDVLLKVGGENGLLMTLGEDIAELDLNPVIAGSDGAVAVDARFILSETTEIGGDTLPKPYDDLPIVERFSPLFAPKSIAVLGASASSTAIANTFIRRLKEFGYAGNIYPIHPKADEVEGFPCYASLAEAPEPIDYAYIAIGSHRVPDVLAAANGNVRFAQVISSGFGEISEGRDLQRELIAKAHAGGCRVLGPNCLGIYSPRGEVTFAVGAPKDLGSVGVVTQSGGLGTDIVKRGQWRGIKFSGLVTAGNSADLGPVDLLEFFFEDPQTKVVGLYLEDIKEGRRFFELLNAAEVAKPVVILRGGTSTLGQAAAASHTGALAGDGRVWQAVSKQTGCVMVETVDEFIDALLAFQHLALRPSKPTKRVVLFGNGGGTSVLATDYFTGLELDILPFDDTARLQLEALNLPPGTSVANPIDTPVRTLQEDEGRIANRILHIVYTLAAPEAVVMHLNLASFVGRGDVDPIDNLINAAIQVQETFPEQAHFVLVLRVDGSPELDEKMRRYREKALSVGIPVYDELAPAAKALKAVSMVEHRFSTRW
ncbi:MAG: acetate--CoA ligase family protein [Alphaproteobacteria bacterium]|jgi:acyl-CoA synthetase (NDP forming)|nr:CoA-binding protein [Rhodospirillaceae bacterium]MDP6023880.1 acetate--CoA ligase family protein [Alphaproteobacteria bacterium]MDP6253127.1 acetate--CoA ligase family protein [Alphaproteobacteria bacterium]MDP7055151.1 acetate--CoA ligase family protein [Alphaproteobacteria bacterium]MDP7228045.1 acetate--CoA ligase family protein [Alphaproteobacteria bacterium]|tara:strand:+ start:17728 stop:19908 length:2181 start_codon:yes stop_codon:yes gene_type:complete